MSRPDPADESKIIDLRQLGALIDPAAPPPASQSAAALPTFGADQLNRPAPRPLLPAVLPSVVTAPTLAPAVAPPATGRGTTFLLVAIGLLTIAVVALAYHVVIAAPTQTIIREEVVMAPSVAAVEVAKDPTPTRSPRAEDPPVEVTASTPVDSEAEPEAAPAADLPRTRRSQARDRKAGRAERREARNEPKPAPNAQPSSVAKSRNVEIPPECVIDPKACGLGGPKVPPPGKPTDVSKPLPTKLSQAAVRTGIGKVKADAKACRSKYGGTTGEKVQVKLTISGATGRVTKAAPVSPHAGTPLGGCVAAALRRAQFGRFTATVQGVQYGVRL